MSFTNTRSFMVDFKVVAGTVGGKNQLVEGKIKTLYSYVRRPTATSQEIESKFHAMIAYRENLHYSFLSVGLNEAVYHHITQHIRSESELSSLKSLFGHDKLPTESFINLYYKGTSRTGLPKHRDRVCFFSVIISLTDEPDDQGCLQIAETENGELCSFQLAAGDLIIFNRLEHVVRGVKVFS